MPVIQLPDGRHQIIIDFPLVNGVRSALPKQQIFLKSLGRDDIDGVAYVGGMGCVAGETRVFDPVTGKQRRIDSLDESHVYAFDGHSLVQSQATRPKQYKKADLYTVTTNRGLKIVVTRAHKFYTSTGWKRLSSLSVGGHLLVCGGVHPQTIWELFRSVLSSSVRHCLQRAQGFLSRCWHDSHPYDERPQLVVGSAVDDIPLRDGAHERTDHQQQRDDPAYTQGGIHSCLSCNHHSRSNCVHHHEHHDQSVSSSTLALASVLPLHSYQLSGSFQLMKDLVDRARQSYQGFLGGFWMAYYKLTTRYDTITSIEFARNDIYFDLHVPTHNSYVAQGFINHNSGKTISGCLKAYQMANKYPGSRGMITNNTYPQLRDSTIATFFNLFPEVHIGKYNESKHELVLNNGSIILFRSVDNPDSLRGSNLLWFFMDEACDSPEYSFQMLMGRWKRPDPNEATQWKITDYKFWLAGNPAGKNWVWKRFFSEKKNPRVLGVHAPTTENTFLDPSYAEMLYEMYSPALAARFIAGNFDSFVGQIFLEWDEKVHVIKPIEIKSHWFKFRAMDFGMKNPTCCLWIAEDEKGCLYVYRELYKSMLKAEDLARQVIAMSVDENGEPEDYIFTVGDTSGIAKNQIDGRSIFDVLGEHEIYVQNARKQDQRGRIDRVRFMLSHGLIKIFNTCENLIDEMPQYQWEPDSMKKGSAMESVRKVHDHAIDALQYAIAHRPDRWGLPEKDAKPEYTKEDIYKVAVPYDYLHKEEGEHEMKVWY
jgi:PBSX family phage terminase large subunit